MAPAAPPSSLSGRRRLRRGSRPAGPHHIVAAGLPRGQVGDGESRARARRPLPASGHDRQQHRCVRPGPRRSPAATVTGTNAPSAPGRGTPPTSSPSRSWQTRPRCAHGGRCRAPGSVEHLVRGETGGPGGAGQLGHGRRGVRHPAVCAERSPVGPGHARPAASAQQRVHRRRRPLSTAWGSIRPGVRFGATRARAVRSAGARWAISPGALPCGCGCVAEVSGRAEAECPRHLGERLAAGY